LHLQQPGYSEGTAPPAHDTAITEAGFHPKGPEDGPGECGASTVTSLSHTVILRRSVRGRYFPSPAIITQFVWASPGFTHHLTQYTAIKPAAGRVAGETQPSVFSTARICRESGLKGVH